MNLKQMNRIGIIWGIILFSLVLLLTIFGFLYKSKTIEYRQMEEQIVNLSQKYVEAKFIYPDEKQSLKITLDELKSNGYIEDFKKENENCDGYVILSHDGFVYNYKGYIKCPKYTTKDYNK